MWFLEGGQLKEYVMKGIASMAGDMAYNTFSRVWRELKDSGMHELLALERSIAYTFDSSEHIFMKHIGRKFVEQATEPIPKNLQHCNLSLYASSCPFREVPQLEHTKAMVCSLCKGYMEAVAQAIDFDIFKRLIL